MTEPGAAMDHEDEAGARLSVHEAVCAERHKAIGSRLLRIETILIGSAGATILLLLNIVVEKGV